MNVTIDSGEYFILLGPTGAGKTLLLETIMGFQKPDQGRILLDDVDITGYSPEKRGIGYVSQNCLLFPHMNVRQNVEFGLKMRGVPQAQRSKAVNEILESTGLTPLEKRRPATLSGGEKQKAVLARVLVTKPSTILLDEPLTGLDPESSRELKELFKQIRKDGKTVVHVTHNQSEGFSLGDRMAIIKSGEIVQVGQTKEVFAKPQTEFVAGFLGYENIFPAQLIECHNDFTLIRAGETTLKTATKPAAEKFVVAIRPEDIGVHFSRVENGALNMLEGTVLDCTDLGPFVTVAFEAGLQLQAVMTKSAFVEANLEAGQKVWLSFKPQAVRVIGKT
ncbi:MAG: ABC transporter ATP-binding protein [Candidatus Bathyarchaeota archaeon]|nr:ABC transporter ATP-binding protein [Candidatus Bathyarchaeota archaeon]